ncbi:MAG: flagellar basal body P-ring formation protein FlgA [Cognatishimia sp.]|uniref:flagellar basal body P-ring formation chaperone FlgA n=1 Tax=Cognatishimia sp. TaxID=2211648 RepID=UPI003B8D6B01
MTRWLHKLLMAAALAILPMTAAAVPTTDLVSERAEQEYGPAMPNNGSFAIRVAQGTPADGEFINEFWIDQNTGQFIANLITDRGEIRRIQGLAILSVPVPVVTRRVMPEEILTEHDIQMIDMPWARVHAFAITEFDNLNGMQVRRMLSPGRPIHRQSVIPPVVVSRGDRVTIHLKYGPLQLTAAGKAISDAHLGQELRVVNLASNKTITAVAKADGTVEALF